MFEGDVMTFNSATGAFECDPGPGWPERVVVGRRGFGSWAALAGDYDPATGRTAGGAYLNCALPRPLRGAGMRLYVESTAPCGFTCNAAIPVTDGSLPPEIVSIQASVPPGARLERVCVGGADLGGAPNVVFLVTGQSNSIGAGGAHEPWNPEDSPEYGVLGWNCITGGWYPARLDDFSLGTKPPGLQCFGFHFAKYLKRRYPGAAVGIVVVGEGGQPISRWSKARGPADIFDASVAVAGAALEHSWASRLSGIMWSQGQADHALDPAVYRACLRGVIDQYRASRVCDPDTPFLACEMPGKKYDFSQETQAGALASLDKDSDRNTAVVPASNLENSDPWHFSTASHRELGRRFLMAWARVLRGHPKPW